MADQPDARRPRNRAANGAVHRDGDAVRLPPAAARSARCPRARTTPAVVEKTEFDFEAPADTDNNPNTGLAGGDIQGRLTMRDVILVNDDSKVKAKVKNPQSGHVQPACTRRTSRASTSPVTRGWTAVDVTVQRARARSSRRRSSASSTSHFEAFDDETQVPSIRAQQAAELLAGPASAKKTIILGDFNSNVPGVQPGDEQAYQTLLDGGFSRAGDRRPDELLRQRPVHVAADRVRPPGRPHHEQHRARRSSSSARRSIGKAPVNGLYNSDHAGVFSKLKIK